MTSSWLCRCGGNSTATAATDGVAMPGITEFTLSAEMSTTEARFVQLIGSTSL
jgi:hypothetical protein